MTGIWRAAAAGTALVLGLAGTACGGGSSTAPAAGSTRASTTPAPTAPSTTSSATPSSSPEPTLADLLRGSNTVHVETADGVRLAGRLFGHGVVGVVLSHQGGTAANQSDWWAWPGPWPTGATGS